ncbi:hypothetical protein COY16_05600 [Candidatus Roizmanbacteria bacterium CG_4_10_14_0_2_um_filter_39_13]|uniref:Uncharacterized protein n=1 Tax=Candidatus Roizmanbacteria bacterium CG_4_10_14_0_2_um_filter_39_13 TaxID=1974825 RepID=A0A2M7TVX5_9BACT|nr:MAG: hypothetical protein COY16_05600 [Candidatus Roizmanbacteria bacterium CG_4_10_14_0_2_um_filter_39_13]
MSIVETAQIASRLLRQDMRPQVQHNGVEEGSLREYLETVRLSTNIIDYIVSPDGKLNIPSSSLDLYALPPEDIYSQAEETLVPLYQAAMFSLLGGHVDNELHFGLFTNHTYDNHIRHVAEGVDRALILAGHDSETRVNGQIAAILHDIPNVLSRSWHHLLGGRFARLIFPKLAEDKKRFKHIRDAMKLHHEPIYEEMYHLNTQSFDAKLQLFQKIHTPESAALLFVDNLDMRRERLYANAYNPRVFDQHGHSEINAFMNVKGFERDDSGDIIISTEFNPWIDPEELDKCDPLAITEAPDNRFHCYASKRVRKNPEDPKSPADFHKALREMWGLYGPTCAQDADRMTLMLAAGFTLFPESEKIVMRFADRTGENEPVVYTFTRETVDQVMGEIRTTYGLL